jgi:hypothetical protein
MGPNTKPIVNITRGDAYKLLCYSIYVCVLSLYFQVLKRYWPVNIPLCKVYLEKFCSFILNKVCVLIS